jgi:hypothetical protein
MGHDLSNQAQWVKETQVLNDSVGMTVFLPTESFQVVTNPLFLLTTLF